MTQLAINFEAARAARDAGMRQALDHAEAANDGWKHEAYTFLLQFCRSHAEFISEDVSDAHERLGYPQPPTKRAWGALYTKAAREGYIAQCGMGRSRLRHASICPKWRSLVYRGAA
jgi:hypothetical protein